METRDAELEPAEVITLACNPQGKDMPSNPFRVYYGLWNAISIACKELPMTDFELDVLGICRKATEQIYKDTEDAIGTGQKPEIIHLLGIIQEAINDWRRDISV